MKKLARYLGASSSNRRHDSQDARRSESGTYVDSSATSSYADPNSSFAALPPRPRKKAEMLSDALDRHESEAPPALVAYANATLHNLRNNVKTEGTSVLQQEIENLPLLVASYNSRYDMDLKSFSSCSEFISELPSHECSGKALRAVVRLFDGGTHHTMIDARFHKNGTTSLIALEPGPGLNPLYMPGYVAMKQAIDAEIRGPLKFAVIEGNAQKSKADCVMFALNYALAAFQKRKMLDEWHKSLLKKGKIKNLSPFMSHLMNGYGVYNLSGLRILPPAFYKHTQSTETVAGLNRSQPGAKDTNLSSGRAQAQVESLEDRLENFRVQRDGESRTISIEASRARKIRHVLESLPLQTADD
ncbi:serine/threonine acetyltransferase [Xanthomonas campestris pv. campestris]|uniref:YopJ family acetyltransferase n=1 Tax=Xanthomonas campestris TaxID=339 RepID=UPI0023788B2A|nr:YopJ family acetyltransferase [Xanthomonas campestris]MDM7583474.1 YopJ family acetyltransferase [Xanthomonas campestris]MDM7590601.1 YopJ family acetyltransferase [Xanthomonas campestris]MEA9862776.1 YopJ family acetyltransferase [Xanthomonas campestris pv. raphani]WDK56452.1 serine/threonine acetyltransferase [Xanthomonas campestris pv. campestris]WDK64636.1 serine/threonine acetyltransferase [Xanthomonas campestris pv. campestris]